MSGRTEMSLKERIKLLEEKVEKTEAWKVQAENLEQDLATATEESRKLKAENSDLRESLETVKAEADFLKKSLAAYSNLEQAIRDLVQRNIELLMPKAPPPSPQEGVQEYRGTKEVADLTLEKVRHPLTLDMSTLRGRILCLITDGLFNKPVTVPNILKALRDQFVEAKRPDLEQELVWYVDQEVLTHQVRADGTHFYQLREDAKKDRIRRVVKET